jgi:hypothetical protein
MATPRPHRRSLVAAGASVVVVLPVLALSACSGSPSSALDSLASKASSVLATATPTKTTTPPPTSSASTPTPTESPTPTKTETATATETRTETATVTTSPTPTLTPTPTPTPTRSETASPGPAPASDPTPWWPWVLGALALLAAGLGAWLFARSRRRHAWEEQVRAATSSLDPFSATFLPRLLAAPADPSMPGAWAVVRPQVVAAATTLDGLVPGAPDAAARGSVAGLSEAAKAAGAAVDTALAPGAIVTPAAVQDLVVKRDALVEATRAARHAAGHPAGGAHS